MQIETFMARMSGLLARIAASANFSLASHPATFDELLTSWLMDSTLSFPNGSIVGLCCSNLLSLQFRDESLGDDGLIAEFRRFMLTASLAHSRRQREGREPKQEKTCVVGQPSGYRLLKRLDHIFTPQFLTRCNRETCQVWFLLVLGSILGLSSESPVAESPNHSEDVSVKLQRSPTAWLSIKEHLCQTLAHHLIFLGSMLGIKLDTQLERRIIDAATSQWSKMESFVWADTRPFFRSQPMVSPEYAALSQGYFWPPPNQPRPYWEEPPPPPLPTIDCLVPDSPRCQPSAVDEWAQNPSSYLAMADEPEEGSSNDAEDKPKPSVPSWKEDIFSATPRPESGRTMPARSNTEPAMQRGPIRGDRAEFRRRSVWLVRPYDAGPKHGQINLYTRLRGERHAGDFRRFV
ncbi:hypothetical protein OQA88_7664 [Cercophora sp. LCS_1]